jgi:hypothetical protein
MAHTSHVWENDMVDVRSPLAVQHVVTRVCIYLAMCYTAETQNGLDFWHTLVTITTQAWKTKVLLDDL